MTPLAGRRVLLVEDESLVAMLAEDMLLDLGCEVVVAMRLDRALAHARSEAFDLAVLDVNLGDARSYPVADLLLARGTPFLFATGYGQHGLDAAYQAVPVLQKPYQAAPLEHLLLRLLSGEDACRADPTGLPPSCRCPAAVGHPSPPTGSSAPIPSAEAAGPMRGPKQRHGADRQGGALP